MVKKTLEHLYAEHSGKLSDKWSIYISEYERLFKDYRDLPIQLLEIGIQNGGSLEIWAQYFEYAQTLIGCDINPDCAALVYEDCRISVVVGDANEEATADKIFSITPSFDLIIDDGSHRSSDIVKSFAKYFPRLRDGGLFIVEDLHCSYWGEFEGGLFDPYSSIAFFKRLADIANYEHWGIKKNRADVLKGFFAKYQLGMSDVDLAHIHSIEFINSICLIRKCKPAENILGSRVIGGRVEAIVQGLQVRQSSTNVALDQSHNEWTALDSPPEEKYQRHLEELAARENAIRLLEKEIAQKGEELSEKNAELDEHRSMIYGLKNSTSWRVTKPVRSVGRRLKQIKQAIQSSRYAVQHTGSVKNAIGRAVSVYRIEGIAGIRQRLLAKPAITAEGQDHPMDSSERYAEWVRRADTAGGLSIQYFQRHVPSWERAPVISIIVSTYNARSEWLKEVIESVQKQIYPHWELYIADDASTNADARVLLNHYASEDNRIKVCFWENDEHISAAFNRALGLATGEWAVLLDHVDVLAEQALYWMAEAIIKHPNAQLIYSDENKIRSDGQRLQPFFKPDWSPHLAISQAYLGNLTCYDIQLIRDLGGLRSEMEESHGYDLWLRASLKAKAIIHIPKILCHSRMHEDATAPTADVKPSAHVAGRMAVDSYLKARYPHHRVTAVDGDHLWTYKADFQLADEVLVSIIIPTRDRADLLKSCIDSILECSTWEKFEILILNNGSREAATFDYFEAVTAMNPRVKVIPADMPFNWSKLNNIGAEAASGEVFIFLNNDTKVISPRWIQSMAGYALLPDVGVVGALLYFEDDTIQHSGVVVGMRGWADHVYHGAEPDYHIETPYVSPTLTRNVLAVTGACTAISRKRFFELGGYDESFIICGSDVELGIRAHRNGYYNVMCAEAKLYHFESKTRTPDVPEEDFKQSDLKYAPYRLHKVDPFYNPNLSLDFTSPVPKR